MAKPFKFRYVNEITGVFVLLVVAAVVVSIFVAGHAQGWFVPVHSVDLVFPPEGSFDLQKGAEVRILGALVGSLQQIQVADDGSMTGEIEIKGDFIRFVRADSQAIAKKKFGVAGDAYLEITKGRGEPLPADGVLKVEKDTEITEMVEQAVQQVKEVALPAIEQLRKAVEEYTGLAADLRNPEGDLQQLIAHLNGISQGLEDGEGTAGKLLRDPSLANEMQEITEKINRSLAEVEKILDDVQETTGVMKGEAQDMSGVVLQTRETMRETEKLVAAIQKHWLLRKYVDQGEPSTLIPASAIGGAQ